MRIAPVNPHGTPALAGIQVFYGVLARSGGREVEWRQVCRFDQRGDEIVGAGGLGLERQELVQLARRDDAAIGQSPGNGFHVPGHATRSSGPIVSGTILLCVGGKKSSQADGISVMPAAARFSD